MGASASVNLQSVPYELTMGDNDGKMQLIATGLSKFLSAKEICYIAQVCKVLYNAVNSFELVWQQLCHTYSATPDITRIQSTNFNTRSQTEVSPSTNFKRILPRKIFYRVEYETQYRPASFVPPSKLPCHTWKQVFQQMINYKHEMEEELRRYKERYELWQEHKMAVACGGGWSRSTPSTHFTSAPLDASFVGFPEHPGKREERVLQYSVDLVRTAVMYIDLLKKVREFKTQFTDENFLAKSICRYVNFLHLKHKYKNYYLIPTLEIEYVWVSHMLRPSKYIADCTALFGEVIDHDIFTNNPYLYLNKATALRETSELYFKEFGETYCTQEAIYAIQKLPLFNETGTALLNAQANEEKRLEKVKILEEAILNAEKNPENPYARYAVRNLVQDRPHQNVFISFGPSYQADVGVVHNTQTLMPSIGLHVHDLLMDDMWLSDFEQCMKKSLTNPLDIDKLLHKKQDSAYGQPSHISPHVVYNHLWKAYEKFLFMVAKYPPAKGFYIHPSPAIDVIWHAHMIYPKIYAKEIKEWVGFFLDHEPWPDCTKTDMQVSVENTDKLWKQEFGVEMQKEHTTLFLNESERRCKV